MARSPLDAMKAQIAKGFKGKLKSGTLRREIPGEGVDEYGDPLPGTTSTWGFEGIRESFDAAYAASAGIPVDDVKILVLAGSTEGVPQKDDQILIESQWHQIRRIADIDPAGATYSLQCFTIEDPTQ